MGELLKAFVDEHDKPTFPSKSHHMQSIGKHVAFNRKI